MGRNRPAEAMPFDGMVRRYFDNLYIVNLLANKRVLTERGSTDYVCARCCTQHLTHTRSGKRHIEPTIAWLRVLRSLDSEMSVIVAAPSLTTPVMSTICQIVTIKKMERLGLVTISRFAHIFTTQQHPRAPYHATTSPIRPLAT